MFSNLIKIIKYKNFDVIFSAGDHLNAAVLLSAIISRSNIKIAAHRESHHMILTQTLYSLRLDLKIIMNLLCIELMFWVVFQKIW